MSLTAKEFTIEKFEHLKKLAGDLFPHKDKKFSDLTPPQAYQLNQDHHEIAKKGAFGIYKAPAPQASTSIGVAPPATVLPTATEKEVADTLDLSIDKVTSGEDTSPAAQDHDADATVSSEAGEVAHDGTAD